MGYDLSLVRAPLGAAQTVLEAARKLGLLIVHTREASPEVSRDGRSSRRWRRCQEKWSWTSLAREASTPPIWS